ncbi:type-2 histone deacetylase 1-like [Senna tora]|uniref:Type-2 histone deacetylase 1-like n=1 Tax=Senna tora TaxID=362788 RepID=A0A834WRS0_9FABA|nr:type-2 histone deacetylase 1-like [Senna tora]
MQRHINYDSKAWPHKHPKLCLKSSYDPLPVDVVITRRCSQTKRKVFIEMTNLWKMEGPSSPAPHQYKVIGVHSDRVVPLPPSTFLNPPTQFGCIISGLQPQSHLFSFVSESESPHHHPSLLHPSCSSSNYNLHHPLSQSQPSSAHPTAASSNLLLPADDQPLAQCNTDPSLQLRSPQPQKHNNNNNNNNDGVLRNPKKRSRASRRAPTTVLTTDTSNFRSMVQEFTGIPAPPFSHSSPYSRRLSSFLFNPNPCSLFSSTNANAISSSTSTTNNNPLQLLPPDLTMHNPPPTALFPPFHSPLLQLQPNSLQHLHPMNPPGVSLSNQHGIGPGLLSTTTTTTSAAASRSDGFRAFEFEGAYGAKLAAPTCKFNFPPSSSSCSFNHDKALDINTASNIRPGEAGTVVDSWICSSD